MKQQGILIIISGFAGVGKGTLVKRLVQKYDRYALSVSMTTRAPRPGEEDGREYFFVTKEKFEEKIAENGLIEYASYCGNYYGTPRAYVEEQMAQGKDIILEIEIQGAMKVRERFPNAVLVYVLPPSAAELESRLRGRATESEEKIHERLSRAAAESEGLEQYDYVIVNDDLDECERELHGILCAAHFTPRQNVPFIHELRNELKKFQKGETTI